MGPRESLKLRPPRRLQRSVSAVAGELLVNDIHQALEREVMPVQEEHRKLTVGTAPVSLSQDLSSSSGVGGPVVFGDLMAGSFPVPGLDLPTDPQHREALLTAIQDKSPVRSLEGGGVLHWHQEAANMMALKTESDGNCLLHALSLGSLGVHDRHLLLRRALASFFNNGACALVRRIRRRWEAELTKACELDKATLDLEWQEVQRSSGLEYVESEHRSSYHYLEATHIFVAAHILRRPIIVLSTDWKDSQGRQLASADEIAGVYLPLEWPKELCHRSPLVLAFDSFHFSALVPLTPDALLPLTDRHRKLLPLPFFRPPSSSSSTSKDTLRVALLKHWMDCQYLSDGVLAVRLDNPLPPSPLVTKLWTTVVSAYESGDLPSPNDAPTTTRSQRHEGGGHDYDDPAFTDKSFWTSMTEEEKIMRLKAIQQEEYDRELALQVAYCQQTKNKKEGLLTLKSFFGGRLWGGGGAFRLRKGGLGQ